jgi:hypothetical protein
MKIITTALVALLASASIAAATDLPSKKAAPAATVIAAPVAAPVATSSDSISASYGQEFDPAGYTSKKNDTYGVNYTHTMGQFTLGGAASTTQASDNSLKQTIEAQAGYKLPSVYGVLVSGKVGVGERFQSSGNFAYYALYGNADYAFNDSITWNAVQYRYRNAFDTSNSFETHRIGTGVTFNVTKNIGLAATVYRDYVSGFNTASYNGVQLGAVVKF